MVVAVGDDTGWPWLDLYLRRPALVALRDTLSAALADLDAADRALTDTRPPTAPRTTPRHAARQHRGRGRVRAVRDTAA